MAACFNTTSIIHDIIYYRFRQSRWWRKCIISSDVRAAIKHKIIILILSDKIIFRSVWKKVFSHYIIYSLCLYVYIYIYIYAHTDTGGGGVSEMIFVLRMTREKQLLNYVECVCVRVFTLYGVRERDWARENPLWWVCPIYMRVCCTSRQRMMIGEGGWRGVCTGGPDDKSYCVNSSPPHSADRCRPWTRGVEVEHCCSRHRSWSRVLYILLYYTYKEQRTLRFADDEDDDRSSGTLLFTRAPFGGVFGRTSQDGGRDDNIKI